MGIVNVFIFCVCDNNPWNLGEFLIIFFLFSSFFHFSFFLFFVFHFFETSPMDVTHQYLPRGSFRSKSYPSPAHQQFVMLSQCLRLCVCAFVCLSVCLSLCLSVSVCLCLSLFVCQRRSRAHFGPTCLTAATTGSRRVCPASRFRDVYPLLRFTWYTCQSGSCSTSSFYCFLSHAPTATC